jgi:ribosomal protein L34E
VADHDVLMSNVGGKLNLQYEKKPAKAPRCGDCGEKLAGVSIPTVTTAILMPTFH